MSRRDQAKADPITLQVGQLLRAQRTFLGWSLADAAERTDGRFQAVTIGSYERGDRNITVVNLNHLARLYGVPVTALIPAPDPPPQPTETP